ncbi:MAG: glycosyltransferase family 4 protein [Pyrinomonadaceae bacterium]
MIKNIVICTTQVPFTSGGGEAHVSGLRCALRSAGYNAEIVALPFKWYPPAEIMRGALAWRLLDLHEANGKTIDMVIGMKFPAYLVAHERKVLWIMHQYRSAYNLWGTEFDDLSTYPDGATIREWIHNCDNRMIPQARKVFANSRAVADRLFRFNKIQSEPLYHPPPRAERLRAGNQGDYIFYPSRLEPQKRQHLLIDAARHLRTAVKIVLAGACSDRAHYEEMIRSAGVAEQICFKDFVEETEILDLYANALGVCYLPFDEDYGYVTLEGMLSAKPLVVPTDGGGATEFIEDSREGLVVEPDPRAIAEALDELYSNRDRARQMGLRGREKLQAMNLSWSYVVEKLVSAA